MTTWWIQRADCGAAEEGEQKREDLHRRVEPALTVWSANPVPIIVK